LPVRLKKKETGLRLLKDLFLVKFFSVS